MMAGTPVRPRRTRHIGLFDDGGGQDVDGVQVIEPPSATSSTLI